MVNGDTSTVHLDNLVRLDDDGLEQAMRNRLHSLSSVGPPIERRGNEEYGFEWLSTIYQDASPNLRTRMTVVMSKFIDELHDPQKWNEPAYVSLFGLLQTSGDGLVDKILTYVQNDELIKQRGEGDGKDVHAGLVKALLAQKYSGTPDFWEHQLDLLGEDYGALIFAGMEQHGLDKAVGLLPRISKSDKAIDWMVPYLSVLYHNHGRDEIVLKFSSVLPQLSDYARRRFSEEFRNS